MKMNIIPFHQVGNLCFGMKREVIRNHLGSNFRTLLKGYEGYGEHEGYTEKNTTDVYDDLDIHVYYNKIDELDALEIGSIHIELIFQDIFLFQVDFKEVINLLQNIDPDLEIEKVGCISYNLGICVYSDNDEGLVDLITVCSQDYIKEMRDIK